MEPDPLPETLVYRHLNDTRITNQDINQILGISKKRSKSKSIYYSFAKKVIILTTTITTFAYLSFYYFGRI